MSKKYKAPGKPAHNRTASGTLTNFTSTYYDKKFLDTLKSGTPFSSWNWDCACGQPVAHRVKSLDHNDLPLCDGCVFRYKVMKAAGRLSEFLADYDAKQKENKEGFATRRPLPARSGREVQMFKYVPATKAVI